MNHRKKAFLAISFGTSYKETRKKTIDAIEEDLRAAFPDYEFRRAYTSPTIVRILNERDGIWIDRVEQALNRLAEEGYRTVLAQTTHVIRGFEYDKLMTVFEQFRSRFDVLECGEPLLTDEDDYDQSARIMGEVLAAYRAPGTDLVLMGHGTEHAANVSYAKLQQAFFDQGHEDCLVGTVEASPTLENMVKLVQERKSARVVLTPFMVVAGNHAVMDMAGGDAKSWKSRFERAGYQVECVMKGLGEYPAIRRMYVEHAKAAERRCGIEEHPGRSEDWNGALREAVPGTLYGIGVGPGDPELLTLKAVRIMKSCDVIVVPGEDYRDSIAFKIAVQAVPELETKEVFGVVLPMTRDHEVLKQHHEMAADRVAAYLAAGKDVGFLNLGDVTVYASYLYIHRLVKARGYRTELVNGIPSFCAAAARLGIGIAENSDRIHILSQPEQIEEGLKLPGTKVIMKMGKNIGHVKNLIREAGMDARMVENCGMENEKIYGSVDEIDEQAGYYSLLIVKNHKDES